MKNTFKSFLALLLIFGIFMTNATFSFAEDSSETVNVELAGTTPAEQTLNNMVYVYNLNSLTLTSSTQSAAGCLKGIYQTSQSGDSIINDIEIYGDYMYLATPEGIEVVSFSDAKADNITSDNPVNLTKSTTLEDDMSGIAKDIFLKDNYLYTSTTDSENGAVVVYDLTAPAEPAKTASLSVSGGVKKMSLSQTEQNLYITKDKYDPAEISAYQHENADGVISFGEEVTENIPVIENLTLGSSPTVLKDAEEILENEKYIFVVRSVYGNNRIMNNAVSIYSKSSGELIHTISEMTSSKYWYCPIRGIHLEDDILYIAWGHGLSISGGAIDQSLRSDGYVQSPMKAYDVSDVENGVASLTIDSGNAYARKHDPYTWGGISYLDSENGIIYTSKVSNMSENRRKYVSFELGNMSDAISGSSTTTLVKKAFHTTGLSMNTSQFIIKDGWLFEVLTQNAGVKGLTSKSLIDECKDVDMVATSDKYIFTATDASGAGKPYVISVYDKESMEYLTRITHCSPSTVYLAVNAMHVKGDYLYVAFTQRNGGDPNLCKYYIKDIYQGMSIEPEIRVGMRPRGYSFINDDVICRTDSGYGNIAIDKTETLSAKAAIGVSADNSALLKSYQGLYLADNMLVAYVGDELHFYDASYALAGVSRQDRELYKGNISIGKDVLAIRHYEDKLYVLTSSGIYTVDISQETFASAKILDEITAPKSIEINNGIFYVSQSDNLSIYDIKEETPSLLLSKELTNGGFNYIHLRPGKLYGATSAGVEVYDISGLEIEETTQAGTVDVEGNIVHSGEIDENISAIAAGGKFLFALNAEKNIVNVKDYNSLENITEIYFETESGKNAVLSMFVQGDYLYVSYDSVLRRYNLSQIEKDVLPTGEAVPYMFTADMVKNNATHIATTDKYIFIVSGVSSRDYLSNSAVLCFDKSTNEYLTSFWIDTGGDSDLAVRNMYAIDDRLFVQYNNAKSSDSYSNAISGAVGGNRYHSPLYLYDVSSIEKGATVSKKLIASNKELASLSHPYNRGGNLYLDEENNLLYYGAYTTDSGQCYKVYDVSEGKCTLLRTLKNGSYDCVKFIAKDGVFYEILDNNAGLKKSGVVSQTYNKVISYDISDETATDLSSVVLSSYTTSIYGQSSIKDIAAKDGLIYLGTTEGVKIIDKATMEKTSLISDVGAVNSLQIKENNLFIASAEGFYIYNISSEPELIAEYSATALDFTADDEKIYITSSRAKNYGRILSYSIENNNIEETKGVVLEDIITYDVAKNENYIYAFSGTTRAETDKISVYNASTGLKTVDITKDSGEPFEIIPFGKLFCVAEENVLNFYKVPSAEAALSDCLVATYEADAKINDVSTDGTLIYLSCASGTVVLDGSSAASGIIKEVLDIAEGEITAAAFNNDFIYLVDKTSGKILLINKGVYTQKAEATIENGENITDICIDEEKIFCLTEEGKVLCYELNEGIIITYNPEIRVPENEEIFELKYKQGFPYITYERNVAINHKYVRANDKYVVTSGAGGIKVHDKDINELYEISASNVSDMYIKDDVLVAKDGTSIKLFNLSDTSAEETEIATASGVIYADESGIYVYDKSALTLCKYSYSGEILLTITECPASLTKIYAEYSLLYLIKGETVYVYDISALGETESASASDIYNAEFTVDKTISAICATEDDYIYVATNNGNAPANKIYIYKVSGVREGGSVSYCGTYESVSLLTRGGKISDMVRRGDYLIVDAYDAEEIQVLNIQKRTRIDRESLLRKGEEDNFIFSDIYESNGKVYAINEAGGLCVYKYSAVDIKDITFVSGENETLVPQEGKVSAKISIYNESGKDISAKLFVAVYKDDSSKELEALTITDVLAKNGEETIALSQELDLESTDGYIVKAMLWDSTDSMQSLCECVQNFKPNEGSLVVYVDASAEAEGDGSESAPFKTIEEAKEYVKTINKSMTGDITVEIAGGRYELSEPLEFGREDSGYNGYKVIYKAKDGEKPIISGGRKIEGWTLSDSEKGIYSAPANGIKTRQLFVDGERAVRARSTGGLTKAECDNGELGIYCYDEFLCDYEHIEDLELVFINKFKSKRAGVDGVYKIDSSGRTLLTVNRPFWQAPSGTSSYAVPSYYENALELLDEENEFYLDVHDDVFYYKPKQGTDISESEIYAPVLEELIVLKGNSIANRVENIEFSGFEISDTTWMLPTENGGFYPTQAGYWSSPNNGLYANLISPVKSAVRMEYAQNIKIDSCEMKNIGATAIDIVSASEDITISNNKIYDISACGVQIGSADKSDANPQDLRKYIKNVKIENNLIHDAAVEYRAFCAVTIGVCKDVSVSHNEIYNTPYSAVHVGWGWDSLPVRNITGLKVEHNFIHNTVQLMSDGGAIYTTGYTMADCDVNPNSISYNYITAVEQRGLYAGAAIYLDTGSSGYLIKGNVVNLKDNTTSWIPKWSNGREGNRFEDNYSTTVNGYSGAVNTFVSETADWDETALAIIENAGIK